MNTIGKFQITDIFTHRANKGEGVIIGDLLDGTVAVGNFLSFMTTMGEKTLRISGIENGKTISGIPFTGLLIELDDQFDPAELKMLKDIEINIQSV